MLWLLFMASGLGGFLVLGAESMPPAIRYFGGAYSLLVAGVAVVVCIWKLSRAIGPMKSDDMDLDL